VTRRADEEGDNKASRESGSSSHSSHASPFGRGRERKFRQAAFFYLHVGILYEAAVWVMARQGIIGESRGPVWIYLLLGAAILAVVVWGLWSWQNRWFARVVWALHALRIPALLEGSFLPDPDGALPPSFYLVALTVVVANLWMLARAGWDL